MTIYHDQIITSVNNARVARARKLQTRKHRQRQSRFLVEGFEVLHLALDARLQPVEIFYCESQLQDASTRALLARFREARTAPASVSPQVMHALSAAAGNIYADRRKASPNVIQTHLVAVFNLFETSREDINLRDDGLVLVLDHTQTPANLGMILRLADAVSAAAVFLIEPCVDIFHPKSVRGSHGSLFSVPVVLTADVPGLFYWLREKGFTAIGADPTQGTLWYESVWKGRTALVLGHDVRGISDEVRGQIEAWVRLPMTGKVQSLNVAVAGGVFIYEWYRVNRLCFRGVKREA